MVKSWTFRIMLLAMGLAGLVVCLANQVDYWDLRTNGKAAMLEQHSKAAPPGKNLLLNDVLQQSFQVTTVSSCPWVGAGCYSGYR